MIHKVWFGVLLITFLNVPMMKATEHSEIDQQIELLLKSDDRYVAENAAAALGEMGPAAKDAVPVLIELLKSEHRDYSVRQAAAEALGSIGPVTNKVVPTLVYVLEKGDWRVRGAAANALGRIGKPALPALTRILLESKDSLTRESVALGLGNVGRPAIPLLLEALKDKDDRVRMFAASSLGKIGYAEEDVVLGLVEAITDKDYLVRKEAIESLGRINFELKVVVPQLIKVLKDEEVADVWKTAVEVLGMAGPEAIPALIRATDDEKSYLIQESAVRALGETKCPIAVPALLVALENSMYSNVQNATEEALVRIGKAAVPELVKELEYKHLVDDTVTMYIRDKAAEILGDIGPAAKDSLPKLKELMKNCEDETELKKAIERIGQESTKIEEENTSVVALNYDIREMSTGLINLLANKNGYASEPVARTIIYIGEPAIPELIKALDNEDWRICSAGATVLGDMGLRTEDVTSSLIKKLEHKNWFVRISSAYAISKVTGDIKRTIPILTEALKHDDPEVRNAAAYAIGNIGPVAKDAVPALIVALKDDRVRLSAENALIKMGPVARDAVPALIKIFESEDEHWFLRVQAAIALGRIGPAAEAAVPALVKALKNEYHISTAALGLAGIGEPAVPALIDVLEHYSDNYSIAWHATYALRKMGPAARDAVPVLIKVLDSKENDVRLQAVIALKKIGSAAKDALPKLKELAEKDGYIRVRNQAKESVEAIQGL